MFIPGVRNFCLQVFCKVKYFILMFCVKCTLRYSYIYGKKKGSGKICKSDKLEKRSETTYMLPAKYICCCLPDDTSIAYDFFEHKLSLAKEFYLHVHSCSFQ